jgi:hypothetical protein
MMRILQGAETAEHQRLEVRGQKAVVVNFLQAPCSLSHHDYKPQDVVELTLADLQWAVREILKQEAA